MYTSYPPQPGFGFQQVQSKQGQSAYVLQSPYVQKINFIAQQSIPNSYNVSPSPNKYSSINQYPIQAQQISPIQSRIRNQQFQQPMSFNASPSKPTDYQLSPYVLFESKDPQQQQSKIRIVQSLSQSPQVQSQPIYYPFTTLNQNNNNTNEKQINIQDLQQTRTNRHYINGNPQIINSTLITKQPEQENKIFGQQTNRSNNRIFLSPDQVSLRQTRKKIFTPASDRTAEQIENEINTLSRLRQNKIQNQQTPYLQTQSLIKQQERLQEEQLIGKQPQPQFGKQIVSQIGHQIAPQIGNQVVSQVANQPMPQIVNHTIQQVGYQPMQQIVNQQNSPKLVSQVANQPMSQIANHTIQQVGYQPIQQIVGQQNSPKLVSQVGQQMSNLPIQISGSKPIQVIGYQPVQQLGNQTIQQIQKQNESQIVSQIGSQIVSQVGSQIINKPIQQIGNQTTQNSGNQPIQLIGSQVRQQIRPLTGQQFGAKLGPQLETQYQVPQKISSQEISSQLRPQHQELQTQKKKLFDTPVEYPRRSNLNNNQIKLEQEYQQYKKIKEDLNEYKNINDNQYKQNIQKKINFQEFEDENIYKQKYENNDNAIHGANSLAENFYEPTYQREASSNQSNNYDNYQGITQRYDFDKFKEYTPSDNYSALRQDDIYKKQYNEEFKTQQEFDELMRQRRNRFFSAIGILLIIVFIYKIMLEIVNYFS